MRLLNWLLDKLNQRSIETDINQKLYKPVSKKGFTTILRISIHNKSREYDIEFGGEQKDILGIVPLIDIIRNRIYEDTELMLTPVHEPPKDTTYVG